MLSSYRTLIFAILGIIIGTSEDVQNFVRIVFENITLVASYVFNITDKNITNGPSEDVQSFIEVVIENLALAASYVPNVDNEDLVHLKDSGIINVNGTFDFIIIGAGAAGCVLAKRLSEVTEWNILVLEARGEQTAFSDIPGMAGYLPASEMNWGYYSIPQTTNFFDTYSTGNCTSKYDIKEKYVVPTNWPKLQYRKNNKEPPEYICRNV